jgi:hypothetical protein
MLIRYLIQHKFYEQLYFIYGNFVPFISNTVPEQQIMFPGGGFIHNNNSLRSDIIGYVVNDIAYVYRKNTWENTTLPEFNIPKTKAMKNGKYVGFYTENMKFKIVEIDPQGPNIEKRSVRRGQICNAQSKKDK